MLTVASDNRDTVIAALFNAGALAVQEDGAQLVTHFPTIDQATAAAQSISAVDPAARVELGETAELDWSAWRASVSAVDVGALTVAPPWAAAGRDPARTISIDPGMGFGTGDHETTRGTLRLLQCVLRRGERVLDLGTGSGVLAIAAAKLGASHVTAVEHDPDAVRNAEANVAANAVGSTVTVIEADAATVLPLLGPVPLVLANIASIPLLALLPAIHAALSQGGRAVIGGVLVAETQRFKSALDGWRIHLEDVEGDWWTAAIAPR